MAGIRKADSNEGPVITLIGGTPEDTFACWTGGLK
jgi:hypothetical protein